MLVHPTSRRCKTVLQFSFSRGTYVCAQDPFLRHDGDQRSPARIQLDKAGRWALSNSLREAKQLTRPCTTPRPEPDLGDVTYWACGDAGQREQKTIIPHIITSRHSRSYHCWETTPLLRKWQYKISIKQLTHRNISSDLGWTVVPQVLATPARNLGNVTYSHADRAGPTTVPFKTESANPNTDEVQIR